MSLSQLLTRPCTIIRRSESGDFDDHGNPVLDETPVETVCELQQRARDEQDLQGELSDTLWLLVLPAGTALRTGDAVEVGGQAYELVGDGWAVRNPRTQQESHVEATLRRTAGDEDVS